MGADKIEDKYLSHISNIRKTKLMTRLDMRIRVQKKIRDDVSRKTHQTDLKISKMYWRSKKCVYGIDNELHLVEQIQKCMRYLFNKNINEGRRITHEEIEELFSFDSEKKNNVECDSQGEIITRQPALDVHMLLSLKIAFNLKEILLQNNVKKYFFTRFKRKLVKKSIIDKILSKVDVYIGETELLERSKDHKIYEIFMRIIQSKFFQGCSLFFIIANTITLGLMQDDISPDFENLLDKLNLAFFSFFCFELISKILGQGFKSYLRDQVNWFDGAVVIISSIDICLQYTMKQESEQSSSGSITALRVLRLLRVFRLAKFWKDIQDLLGVLLNALNDLKNITILLAIFLITFMLVGMEVFGYKLDQNLDKQNTISTFENSYSQKFTFNTFSEAFLSTFLVLANDGWTRIFFSQYRVSGVHPVATSLFFIFLIIGGQFILINLFISVLVEHFEQYSVKYDLVKRLSDLKRETLSDLIIRKVKCQKRVKNDKENYIDKLIDQEAIDKAKKVDQEKFETPSLLLFKYEGTIRQWFLKIINHPYFETYMLIIILLNTIQIAIENPLSNPNTSLSKIMNIVDYIMTGVFTLEIVGKIIANGLFFCGERSFLANYLNFMDIGVVVVSILSYFFISNMNAIKALRLIKILRPLRATQFNPNLRIAIKSLAIAFPAIINILFIMLLFLFVYGIICVNYFHGLFYNCTVDGLEREYTLSNILNRVDNKWDCLNAGAHWKHQFLNFDDAISSMGTLFIMSNSVGWSDIMFFAAKTRGKNLTLNDSQSINLLTCILFVSVIIIGNFFFFNLSIGVIIAKYNRETELQGKNSFQTEEQTKQVKLRLKILQAQPIFRMRPPQQWWRLPFFYIAESKYVNYFSMACIIANTVVLSLEYYGQPKSYVTSLENVNFIFSIIFAIEVLIKIAGYGQRMLKDSWNVFDLIILAISFIGIMINSPNSSEFGPQTTIVRSFRIVRVFFIFKKNKSLRATLMTFIVSLPTIVNIGSLIILINMIYSILGVNLFAQTKLNNELNEHANFQTIGIAFLTLVRITTGEQWPKLMEALSRENSPTYQCVDNPTYDQYVQNQFQPLGCGNKKTSQAFFFSYTFIITTVLLRLFIAVVLQTFKTTTERENKFMNTDLSDHFREVWSRYDPDATGYIRKHIYPKFLQSLGDPLGWDLSYNFNYIKQLDYLAEISLPIYNTGGEYQFMDVFEHLVLIMIVRREVINFGIKNKHFELFGIVNKDSFFSYDIKTILSYQDNQNELWMDQNPIITPFMSKNHSSIDLPKIAINVSDLREASLKKDRDDFEPSIKAQSLKSSIKKDDTKKIYETVIPEESQSSLVNDNGENSLDLRFNLSQPEQPPQRMSLFDDSQNITIQILAETNKSSKNLQPSIFEISPKETFLLENQKSLRNFAFNKDGDNLKNQYKIDDEKEQLEAGEEMEYEDILKDDSAIIDEELMNLATKSPIEAQMNNQLKVLAEAAIENEDYLVNEEMIMMKGNSQIEGLEEAHSMKLQEVKQEEILPSSDSEAENEDNFFEREMNRLDEELSYLNKKKNDDSNDDSQQSPSRQQMAEELDKDDIEKQYLNRATMESPNSHQKKTIKRKGELLKMQQQKLSKESPWNLQNSKKSQ